MENKEYFYCYSPALHVFLRERNIRYTCMALNENTLRKFWQYKSSPELGEALATWAANKPK